MPLSREKMRLYMRERRKRDRLEVEALRVRVAELELLKEKMGGYLPVSIDSLVDKVVRAKR